MLHDSIQTLTGQSLPIRVGFFLQEAIGKIPDFLLRDLALICLSAIRIGEIWQPVCGIFRHMMQNTENRNYLVILELLAESFTVCKKS